MGKAIATLHFQVEKVAEDEHGIEITLGTQKRPEEPVSAAREDNTAPRATIFLGAKRSKEIFKYGDRLEVVVSVLE